MNKDNFEKLFFAAEICLAELLFKNKRKICFLEDAKSKYEKKLKIFTNKILDDDFSKDSAHYEDIINNYSVMIKQYRNLENKVIVIGEMSVNDEKNVCYAFFDNLVDLMINYDSLNGIKKGIIFDLDKNLKMLLDNPEVYFSL